MKENFEAHQYIDSSLGSSQCFASSLTNKSLVLNKTIFFYKHSDIEVYRHILVDSYFSGLKNLFRHSYKILRGNKNEKAN